MTQLGLKKKFVLANKDNIGLHILNTVYKCHNSILSIYINVTLLNLIAFYMLVDGKVLMVMTHFFVSLKDLHYCSDIQMKVTNTMFTVL